MDGLQHLDLTQAEYENARATAGIPVKTREQSRADIIEGGKFLAENTSGTAFAMLREFAGGDVARAQEFVGEAIREMRNQSAASNIGDLSKPAILAAAAHKLRAVVLAEAKKEAWRTR